MKNHIIFKFLAVLLCAAMLVTGAASALGIFALNEAGAYQRSVDEAYDRYLGGLLESAAVEIAQEYAAMQQGGLSFRMTDAYYGPYSTWDNSFRWSQVGYVLKDAQGNVIQSEEPYESLGAYRRITSNVELVVYPSVQTTMTREEYEVYSGISGPTEPAHNAPYIDNSGGTAVYDAVPLEGAVVNNVTIGTPDSSEGVGSPDGLGSIWHDSDGRVVFHASGRDLLDLSDPQAIVTITFENEDQGLLFQASDPSGIGRLYTDDQGLVVYESRWSNPAFGPEHTEPETQEETVEATTQPTAEVTVDPTAETRWGGFSSGDSIYSTPNVDSEVLGTVPPDAELEILDTFAVNDRLWYLTAEGWIPSEPVRIHSPREAVSGPEIEAPEPEAPAWVIGPNTRVYATPNTDSAPLEGIVPGTAVDVIRQVDVNSESWILSSFGWVKLEELEAVASGDVPQTAAEEVMHPTEETIPMESTEEMSTEETLAEGPVEATEPVAVPTPVAAALEAEPAENLEWFSYMENGEAMMAGYVLENAGPYTLEFTLGENALTYEYEWTLLRLAESLQKELPVILIVSVLLFAVFAVYLCCAAGRKPGTDVVRAGGLNRLPIDGYFAAVCLGVTGIAWLGVEGTGYLMNGSTQVALLFAAAMCYGAGLLVVAFCFAFAAQLKTPEGFWWRNSLCGWGVKLFTLCLSWSIKAFLVVWGWFTGFCHWFARVLDEKLVPLARRGLKALWKFLTALLGQLRKWALALLALLKTLWDRFAAWVVRFVSVLPMTWQWLLTGFAIILVLALTVNTGAAFWGICLTIAMVLYGTHAFGVLLEGVKHMNKGDLESKVDDKLLIGSFREFAGELNGLADVAVVAAQKQLKSERMKTELITNVSHDIKTPLTSIINYVDLLEKPHTPEEQEVYLEVLSRQSNRLKKLIEDLMEMSKASTGNMSVDIRSVDAVEAVNQALGEFADKLDKAELIPVFRKPEEPIAMMADGRLVWRVMSNLLGNAVKYALPGTRLYIDLSQVEGKVILSMKNISREELNVNADELLERFVRGDASRNTEGSGLGLNIAQSLMELQKGQLQILVDGDLFKVTLIFPAAEG